MDSRSHSARCPRGLSAADFFKDSPWLNVPGDRLGEILTEPLYPKLGLLGGTSKQESAPKSKLAALAAARKKKENLKSKDDSVANSSVALLDKLGRSSQEAKPHHGLEKSSPASKIENTKDVSDARPRKYPVRRPPKSSTSDEPRLNSCLDSTTTPSSSSTEEQVVIALAAAPSTFAKTISGSMTDVEEDPKYIIDHHAMRASVDDTKFDFAGPSPDDVVLKAQNSKHEIQKPDRPKPPTTDNSKASDDLVQGVQRVEIEEARVRRKNLNVLAEFEKSKPKKSANFVVIGISCV